LTQHRARFDATVIFTDGGGLHAQGFRVDVPHDHPTEAEIAERFVASLGLHTIDRVVLANVEILAEPHAAPRTQTRWVELSHVISAGMTTYPGLPGPEITPHLTREASRQVYEPGTEFAIDRVSMVGNTGTYLDSPYHRYADGADLAGLPLTSLADLPAVVVRRGAERGVGVADLAGAVAGAGVEVAGHAVLLHTGGDTGWGTDAYATDAPFLTRAGAAWLVEHGAALVGIDAVNIDDISGDGPADRPAHSLLLAAGIPVVEHLTGLNQLPPTGARFTAAPPRFAGFGTFPVRAYASVPSTSAAEKRLDAFPEHD
jgi:arylformamidase